MSVDVINNELQQTETVSVADSLEVTAQNLHNTTLERLSKLSPVEYDRVRVKEAKALGIRPATLDKEIANSRKDKQTNVSIGFEDVEPWESPVDGAELLNELAATVKRFIICHEETAHAVALWVTMTWLIDVVHVAPLAIITAPEKRCGKTQLLSLMSMLVKKPITASGISPAALFRSIEKWQPCLLIDEADAFMKDNEEIRLLLNSGHTRAGAFIIRTVGENHEPTRFNTWGAKVLCGISAHKLADTLTDRAVLLELRRKLGHESVERLRYAETGLFDELSAKLARFADDCQESVRNARPELPSSLNDRAQDNWEPLLAIASVAGGVWPELALKAALKLSGADAPTVAVGTELLSDIQEIFISQHVDRISTVDMIRQLCTDEEKPWATYNRGRSISPSQVSKRLKEYGIHSKPVRHGTVVSKGYTLEQFQETFDRYLSDTVAKKVTGLHPSNGGDLNVTFNYDVTVTELQKVTHKPPFNKACNLVTDNTPSEDFPVYTEQDFEGFL